MTFSSIAVIMFIFSQHDAVLHFYSRILLRFYCKFTSKGLQCNICLNNFTDQFAEFDDSNTFQTCRDRNNERLRKLWNAPKKHLFGTFHRSTGSVVTGEVTAEMRRGSPFCKKQLDCASGSGTLWKTLQTCILLSQYSAMTIKSN